MVSARVYTEESVNRQLGELNRVELPYLGLDFVHYATEKVKMVKQ